ncbi:DUF1289 domain-containing protein [Marinomonas pollencensis]|uniref:Fe-S protein YdhL (DUF1289 family) n=1 Tax=Marinomonas pollencensis TaxID=491954 RepID=A0A3E0DPV0_9GAMM|nr:DUF1289 domain-containing protein [Marinomonas pollencensis]REG84215.1 hypothetical protein DFP81_10494 [Marinomonas pollencensis]
MSTKATKKASVKSPCVNLCLLNDDDVCVGCYRTGKEISSWGRMSAEEQRHVLVKVSEREQASQFVS